MIEPPYAALEALLRQGRAPEAEHAARVRLAAAPADGVLWRLLGAALLEQRKDALGALERAADLLRGDAAAQAMLGAALHQRGRMPEAAIRYGRALDLEPGLAEVHNNLGNVLLELGRPADAVGCFERAARLAPDDASQGTSETAQQDSRQAEIEPDDRGRAIPQELSCGTVVAGGNPGRAGRRPFYKPKEFSLWFGLPGVAPVQLVELDV